MPMLKICVIFGGINSEYEISLLSVTSVIENLDKSKYDVIMLGITKSGKWLHYTGPVDMIAGGTWDHSSYVQPAVFSTDRTRRGLILLDGGLIGVDVAFPVLHGKNGEDGTMQGLLELAGIPCVGCGLLSSALCLDKEISHRLLQHAGIPKTKLIAVHQDEMDRFDDKAAMLEAELGYPMFVKPANAGSSVGISKARNRESLREALETAFLHDAKAVVEQMMHGQEVECAVLGNREPVAASVLGEVEPTNEFYDYAGKYLDDSTKLHTPARIPEEAAAKVRELAVKAYRAMGCRGMARVDFFVKPDGAVVLNEINTIPGFTTISMYPRMFIESGMSYPELLDRLINLAREV
jgi:D-alanine--D-alanine ligase